MYVRMSGFAKFVECFFKHLRRHRMSRAFFSWGGRGWRGNASETTKGGKLPLFRIPPSLGSPGYKEEKEEGKKGKKPFVSLLFTRGILPFFAILRFRSTDFPPSRLKTVASLTLRETHRRPAAWPRARASCWPRSLRRRCSWPCRAPSPG